MGDMGKCDPKIYSEGTAFAIIHGPAEVLEAMVVRLRTVKGCEQTDWHYVGGWGVFKTLGDVKFAKEQMDLVMPIRRTMEDV